MLCKYIYKISNNSLDTNLKYLRSCIEKKYRVKKFLIHLYVTVVKQIFVNLQNIHLQFENIIC